MTSDGLCFRRYEATLRAAGISPGLVRLSVGYTGTLEDRLAQLERGYRAAGG